MEQQPQLIRCQARRKMSRNLSQGRNKSKQPGLKQEFSQEAQTAGTIMIVLHLLPMYVIILFFKDPHSSLAVLLGLLPFTSLMTVGMRNLLTIVPAWQVLVSTAVQVVCTLGMVWLASRAFRLSMLRFGQRLNWRHLLRQA